MVDYVEGLYEQLKADGLSEETQGGCARDAFILKVIMLV